MKKSFHKILLCTSLALSTIVGITLTPATSVEAAGVTYKDLPKGHSTMVGFCDSYELVSGSSVVSLSPEGWVTALNYGDAVIYGYKNGVHYWTWYYRVI
ncbi:hypothetical protein [Paenibacillus sp. B1-33]|uniref:hypothetical protein n=1 Tax=unclassified Paenibacillus TaxID=185978 RepID=UPI003D2C90FF